MQTTIKSAYVRTDGQLWALRTAHTCAVMLSACEKLHPVRCIAKCSSSKLLLLLLLCLKAEVCVS